MTIIRAVTNRGQIRGTSNQTTVIVHAPEDVIVAQTELRQAAEAVMQQAVDLRSTANVTLLVPGSQGPQGPQGPPGEDGLGEPYEEQINSPSSEWIINHNLGRSVSVEVTDLAGDEFICEVHRPTNNQVRVVHTSPQTGIVIIT